MGVLVKGGGERRAAGRVAAFIGTAIEWHDFIICGTVAALVLGREFCPGGLPGRGDPAAFATFSIGFVPRRLGVW